MTASAHPHATKVAVYPALLRYDQISQEWGARFLPMSMRQKVKKIGEYGNNLDNRARFHINNTSSTLTANTREREEEKTNNVREKRQNKKKGSKI